MDRPDNPPWRPLPLSFDEVTPAWLSVALSWRRRGTEVESVSFGNRRDGTSSSARLELRYAAPGDLPPTLYIKGGFVEAMRRRVWAGLEVEARFFAEVAPELTVNIPSARFAGTDPERRQAIVILDDLARRGVSFGHATRPIAVDTMAQLMDLLAEMHAQWWLSSRLDALADGAGAQRLFVKYLLRPKYWAEVLQRPYAPRIPAALRDPARVASLLDRMWALNDARVPTLLHGDTHAGNLFFEADGRPGLMDWQCAQKGHGAHDVMWTLVNGFGIDERRANERDLIRHYLEGLRGRGIDAPTFDAMWLAYRQSLMYGVSCGVANPYDMQNEEVTTISAERILAAVSDLDSAGSLGG